MIELFALALYALVVVLYVQARFAAREIRRNRERLGAAHLSTATIRSQQR